MSLKFQRLNSYGDTIIEVLIVLTILGMAVAISYATANRSLLNARQAEENSQATEYAQGQIEDLFSSVSANGLPNSKPQFCFDTNNAMQTNPTICGMPNASAQGSFGIYSIWVYNCDNPAEDTVPPSPGDTDPCTSISANSNTFVVRITWQDILGQGVDSVLMAYKVHLPSAVLPTGNTSGGGGLGGGGSPSGFDWFVWGKDYAHGGPSLTTCSNYGDDLTQPNADLEDYCDPPGPHVVNTVNDCGYGVTTNGINPPTANPNSMFMRRSTLVTFDMNKFQLTSPANPNPIVAGPAFLQIDYNQYAGVRDYPPPAGYTSTSDTKYNKTPGLPYLPYPINKNPSNAYEYTVNILISNAAGVPILQTQQPVPLAPNTSNNGWTAITSAPILVDVPSGPLYVQVGWLNNEHDQDGNGLCTPNHDAPGGQSYDPDLQINKVRLYNP